MERVPIVNKDDLIGNIKDFPIQVVQKMCEEQVKQGNKFDPTIFQQHPDENKRHGGFTWDSCKSDDAEFWNKVIFRKEFSKFFENYPVEYHYIKVQFPSSPKLYTYQIDSTNSICIGDTLILKNASSGKIYNNNVVVKKVYSCNSPILRIEGKVIVKAIILEKVHSTVKDVSKLKINTWYRTKHSSQYIYRTGDENNYGFVDGKWKTGLMCSSTVWKEVTDLTPIQELFLIEIIRRYGPAWEHCKLDTEHGFTDKNLLNSGKYYATKCFATVCQIWNTNGMLFDNGKWIKPLEKCLWPELKTHTWYEDNNHLVYRTDDRGNIGFIKNTGEFKENYFWCKDPKQWEEASKETVYKYLSKEAEKRGYKVGTVIEAIKSPGFNIKLSDRLNTCLTYTSWSLEHSTSLIFHQGKWANIISQPEEYPGIPTQPDSTVLSYNTNQNILTPTKNTPEMKKGFLNTTMSKFKQMFTPELATDLRITLDGNIAVPSKDGDYVVIQNKDLVSYPAEMVLDIQGIFIISKQATAIQKGDIIKCTNGYAKVTKIFSDGINITSIKVLSFNGTGKTVIPVKDFILGQSMVQVVVNMFSSLQGQDNAPINPMMLAMMSQKDGGDSSSMEALMMMSMMQGNKGGPNNMQAMLPMMLISKKGGDSSDMMETMLMASMFQNQGSNPFGNLFGQSSEPKALPTPKKKKAAKEEVTTSGEATTKEG